MTPSGRPNPFRRSFPRNKTVLPGLLFFAMTLLWIFILADQKVFHLFGVHIYNPYILNLITHRVFFDEIALEYKTYLSMAGAALMILGFHLILFLGLRRLLHSFSGRIRLAQITAVFLVAGTSLALLTTGFFYGHPDFKMGQTILGPWPRALGDGKNTGIRPIPFKIKYPIGQPVRPKLQNRKNVVVLVIESFRADAFSETLTPHLLRFVKERPCLISNHHFSGGHDTSSGLFPLIFGINAYYAKPFSRQGLPAWPMQVLQENGYQTIAFSAGPLAHWPGCALWVNQFEEYTEIWQHKNYKDDERLIKRLTSAFEQEEIQSPFFLVIFLHATHHNYTYPIEFERFRPVIAEDYNHFMGDDRLSRFRTKIVNRYKNSVIYIDHLFSRILALLRKNLENDNLILVVTGDHGEEFWDRGLLGHAADTLTQARIQVPLILYAPGIQARKIDYSGHVDVFPTLFDYLDMDPLIPAADYSDGRSFFAGTPGEERRIIVSAASRTPGRLKLAVITEGNKFILEEKGASGGYDLIRMTDMADKIRTADGDHPAFTAVGKKMPDELYRFLQFQTPDHR